MFFCRIESLRPPIAWPKQLEECEIPREKIVMNRTIGQGQFGTVYGGEVRAAYRSMGWRGDSCVRR